jgi:hypothetical protein
MRRFAVVLLLALIATSAAGAVHAEAPPEMAIHASFVPEHFLTKYSLYFRTFDRSKTVTGRWHLTAPANDKSCNLFVPQKMTRDTSGVGFMLHAAWLHGDQHGCHHERMGRRGHLGTVTLVYADTKWSCTASYHGSISGDHDITPAVCRRRA